jgi:hypothetical protein
MNVFRLLCFAGAIAALAIAVILAVKSGKVEEENRALLKELVERLRRLQDD